MDVKRASTGAFGAGAAHGLAVEPASAPRNVELLANVVEQTADAVIVTDTRGLVEYVNPAFETMTGYSRDEMLGRSPSLLKSGRHDGSFYRKLWDTILAGEVYRATVTNRTKSGSLFVFEQTITPIKDAAGTITHFVAVAKDITERERATRLEGQLMLARDVQQKCYPAVAPRVGDFEIAGAATLADVTGGDYFDYLPLNDGSLGIVIGDASGHGVDSALLMVETRAYLRSLGSISSDPGQILTEVNRLLSGDIPGASFVTLLLLSLDPRTCSLRYAGAGHVGGYVVDAAGCVRAELQSDGLPLGLFPDRRYETAEAPHVRPGDVIALLTDGVIDAESPCDTRFGRERALGVIRDHVGSPADAILERLFESLRAFGEGLRPEDDYTAVLCKRLPARAG